MSKLVYRRSYSTTVYFAVILMIFGVALATITENRLVVDGIKSTLLMVIASNLQNFILKYFMHKLELHPLALYFNIHFFGFLIVIPIWLYADFHHIYDIGITQPSVQFFKLFTFQGFSSFGSHLMKATLIPNVSAVTYAVAGSGKSIFKILLGFLMYKQAATWLNIFGTFLAVAGVLIYSLSKLRSKEKKEK